MGGAMHVTTRNTTRRDNDETRRWTAKRMAIWLSCCVAPQEARDLCHSYNSPGSQACSYLNITKILLFSFETLSSQRLLQRHSTPFKHFIFVTLLLTISHTNKIN